MRANREGGYKFECVKSGRGGLERFEIGGLRPGTWEEYYRKVLGGRGGGRGGRG